MAEKTKKLEEHVPSTVSVACTENSEISQVKLQVETELRKVLPTHYSCDVVELRLG